MFLFSLIERLPMVFSFSFDVLPGDASACVRGAETGRTVKIYSWLYYNIVRVGMQEEGF